MAQTETVPAVGPQPLKASMGVWLAATIMRIVFIAALVLVVVRVSLPQSETISTAYETPNDLVRMALGAAVCVWLLIQLFRGSADASAHRTWIYLGAVAIPLTLLCLAYIW